MFNIEGTRPAICPNIHRNQVFAKLTEIREFNGEEKRMTKEKMISSDTDMFSNYPQQPHGGRIG